MNNNQFRLIEALRAVALIVACLGIYRILTQDLETVTIDPKAIVQDSSWAAFNFKFQDEALSFEKFGDLC